MSTFSALHRLIAAEITVQEGQLDTLESILVLAGERSSSIPDPHHMIEGDAAERLIALLLGEEEKHDRVVPLISSEVEHVDRRLRRPEGAPPSHLGTLAKELEDFSALQADALKSLRSGPPDGTHGLTISAAMASKLFDVLATKLELLKELQDGFVQLRSAEAEEAARAATQQSSQPPAKMTTSIADAVRSFGSDGATKQSLGLKFAKSLVADGIDALGRNKDKNKVRDKSMQGAAAITAAPNPIDAARRAATAFLGSREDSTASSAATWKNDFHEAVMRTMMQSESPEEALAGVVSRMPNSTARSTSADSHRSPSASSRSESEAPSERDARRRNARRRVSPSPSPAPPSQVELRHAADTEARNALQSLRFEVDDLQGSTSELLTEANRIIADCDEAVLQLSTENESLRQEVLRLQKAAASRRRDGDESDHQVNMTVQKLHQSLVDAKSEGASLSRLLDEERRQHASCQKELTTLQEEYRRASHAATQQKEALHRSIESERHAEEALTKSANELNAAKTQHQHDVKERDALVAALRLRVQSLEKEASSQFTELESSRQRITDSARKLERKQAEVRNVKILFTELEASSRETKSELAALRAVVSDKDDALGRYANLSRLKELHGVTSPTRRGADATVAPTTVTPLGGTTPRGAGVSHGGGRRGSHGRLVRLSFDSPARAPTPTPQEPPSSAKHFGAAPRPSGATNSQHVQRVLADAASLLASIHKTRRSAEATDQTPPVGPAHHGDEGGAPRHAPRVPPSLQAMNGSEDGVAPVTPLTRPQLSQQQLLHDLEEKERHLMSEAASLAEQERSLLDKRSVVSSTLLAQRNQMLMKNAPDEEVEKLNNQISAVMERINQTTAQIQQNKRSVESKMDLMQRQRRALLAGGGL